MKKISYLLAGIWIIPSLTFAQELAQEKERCETLEPLEKLICQDDGLSSYDKALQEIWKTWQEGINANRIEYLENEQAQWLLDRTECLVADDPTACLTEDYANRISTLTSPRVFQSTQKKNGEEFRVMRALTPLSFDELEAEMSLLDLPYFSEEFNIHLASLTEALDGECDLCTRERQKHFERSFESDQLLIVGCKDVEQRDDGDPIHNYRSYLFDKSMGQSLHWSELFQSSTLPFAKSALVDAIMTELEVLNRQVKGNADGSQKYYWHETRENLSTQSDEDWQKMGLKPISEGGKIAAFLYQADDFEFAPYGSSNYFTNFRIEADAIIPFLKDEYRENFE